MPWSIDGPSADQLGYVHRERGGEEQPAPEKWRWRWWGVAVVVVALAAMAVPLILHLTASPPAIATAAPGSWREVGTEHRLLTVERADDGSFTVYSVLVGGTQTARVENDNIGVLPSRGRDETGFFLTYEPATDRLTLTTDKGTFTFAREP